MWHVVSTREIFCHPRLTLMEDEVLLPNGHRTTYLRHADEGARAVTLIAVRDGRVLMQREYSHPPCRVLLQFPGGGVAPDESIEQWANRELMEEAWFRAGALHSLGSYLVDNRRSTEVMHVLLATDLTHAPLPPDAEEDIESVWHTEAEIDALVREGGIVHAHALASWCLYRARA